MSDALLCFECFKPGYGGYAAEIARSRFASPGALCETAKLPAAPPTALRAAGDP
jgi:hypothetical protein